MLCFAGGAGAPFATSRQLTLLHRFSDWITNAIKDAESRLLRIYRDACAPSSSSYALFNSMHW